MAYIGNQPASAFASTEKQTITGNGTTGPYALTHEVSAATDIACFVNNVRQEPGVAYTVSGNQMTMTGNVASTDDFYVVYIGRVVGTATHPSNAALVAASGTFNGDVSATVATSRRLQVGKENITQAYPNANNGYIADFQGDPSSGQTYISIAAPNVASLGSGGTILGEDQTDTYLYQRTTKHMKFGTNDLNRLIIDGSAGHVTMPYQPAFEVRRSGGTINVGSNAANYAANAIELNRGNHYNSSTHRFIAPVAGVYSFYFWAIHAGMNTGVLQIRVNGTVLAYGHTTGPSGQWSTSTVPLIDNLVANDYVEAWWANGTGSFHGSPYTAFGGYLIG